MVAYSFNKRFIDPIRVGLSRISLSFDCPPKRQTIRAVGKRRHARPGEILQLYTGMRTKQCEKIGDARCTEVLPIAMKVTEHTIAILLNDVPIGGGYIHAFAQSDGFAHGEDMLAFWLREHGKGRFDGLLIKWAPM